MRINSSRITELAEVIPGYSLKVRAVHQPTGTHCMVLAKHLVAGARYQHSDEHALRVTPKTDVNKYLIKQGDVLFVSRGIHNHACPVLKVPTNAIASSTLYIVRPVPDIDPGFLAWCINQSCTQSQIAQARTGAGTPIVQRNAFSEIRIPYGLQYAAAHRESGSIDAVKTGNEV